VIIETGDFRIAPFEAGWVLQKRVPTHAALRAGRNHAKGDTIPERWDDVCYPSNVAHGLGLLHEQCVRLSCAHAKDLKDARSEWKRLTDQVTEAAALATASGDGAQVSSDASPLRVRHIRE
jgi:hypothetical protein